MTALGARHFVTSLPMVSDSSTRQLCWIFVVSQQIPNNDVARTAVRQNQKSVVCRCRCWCTTTVEVVLTFRLGLSEMIRESCCYRSLFVLSSGSFNIAQVWAEIQCFFVTLSIAFITFCAACPIAIKVGRPVRLSARASCVCGARGLARGYRAGFCR